MPGKFVSNYDGSWAFLPEGHEMQPWQSEICSEDNPRRNEIISRFLGVKIDMPPYKKEKDLHGSEVGKERSFG